MRQPSRQSRQATQTTFTSCARVVLSARNETELQGVRDECIDAGADAGTLLVVPLDVVDYVVIHELAHTVHHNHSKRFWGLVEKILPDYKNRRKHLKKYGQQIL